MSQIPIRPDPDFIAAGIAEDLRAALEQFEEIQADRPPGVTQFFRRLPAKGAGAWKFSQAAGYLPAGVMTLIDANSFLNLKSKQPQRTVGMPTFLRYSANKHF